MKIIVESSEDLNALLVAWAEAQGPSVRRVRCMFTRDGASFDFEFIRSESAQSESPDPVKP